MKKTFILFIVLTLLQEGFSQTNIFPESGNVGIGTTTPIDKLHVKDGNIITSDVNYDNINARLTCSIIPSLKFTRWTGSGQLQHNAFVGQFFNSQFGEYSLGIGTGASSNGNQDTYSVNMAMTLNGNVGIGTTNPTQKLEIGSASLTSANYINIDSYGSGGQEQGINFNAYYGGNLTTSYINNDFYGSYPTYSGSAGHGMNFLSGRSSPFDNYWFRNASGNVVAALVDLNYYASSMGTFASTHQLLIGGSVGIGTTNPGSFKLAVEGNIGARKVIVTKTSPFPDYVFNKDYKLPPLTQIEQYIKTNKHLPEVSTAKEVEKNGIDLGDNQALLLKKIEELTLYLIEQNKKTEKLEKENKGQSKEIKTLKGIASQQERKIEQLEHKK